MELPSHPRRDTNAIDAVKQDKVANNAGTAVAPPARPTTRRSSRRPSLFIPRKPTPSIASSRQLVDTAEEINRQLSTNAIYRDAFFAGFEGPGVRNKVGKRYETEADLQEIALNNKLVRELNSLHVEGTEKLMYNAKRRRIEELKQDPTFALPDRPYGEPFRPPAKRDAQSQVMREASNLHVEDSEKLTHGAERRRIEEPKPDQTFILPHRPHGVSLLHGPAQPTPNAQVPGLEHVREPIKEQNVDKIYDQPEDNNRHDRLYCVCKARTTDLMVPCEECAKPFHPGCMGQGSLADNMYTGDFRAHAWRADFQQYSRGKSYRCSKCTTQYGKFDAEEGAHDDDHHDHHPKADTPTQSQGHAAAIRTYKVDSQLGKRARDSNDDHHHHSKADTPTTGHGHAAATSTYKVDDSQLGKRARGPDGDVELSLFLEAEAAEGENLIRRSKRRRKRGVYTSG